MSKKFFLLVIGGFGAVLVIVLASIGGFAFFSGHAPANSTSDIINTPTSPSPPPLPQISLTIRKLKTGNSLIIQWTNLPASTAALDLFCSSLLKPEPSSSWTLWKEILLSSGELAAGDREVALGAWYQRCSFYVVQAITAQRVGTLSIGATTTLDFANGQNGIDASDGNDDSTILWTSGITLPGVTTSTIGMPAPPAPLPPPPPENQNGSSTNSGNAPSASSSPITNNPQPTSSYGGVPPNTPTGTPYYDPQVQVYGYAASGSPIFWVQHANQGIEIGWQNIPPETDSIVILRSDTANGPWTAFLTEQNLPTNNYSLEVVDDSLTTPYYYQMQALAGTSTVAIYGPDYLAPTGE